MNWTDAMKENAALASRELAFTDTSVVARDASASWDPHEVWLKRVRLPRELAARKQADGSSGQ